MLQLYYALLPTGKMMEAQKIRRIIGKAKPAESLKTPQTLARRRMMSYGFFKG
jgi:hypothetical protein